MSGTLLSPGVAIQEIDLTTIIPAVATTIGGTAGFFRWGPVNKRILVDTETTMAKTFQPPNSNNSVFYWSTANFLSYGNQEYVVRANSGGLFNATASGTAIMIPNEDTYYYEYGNGNNNTYGQWFARYPSDLGNSLFVSTCPSAQAYSANLTALYGMTANANVGSKVITMSSATAASNVVIGDLVQVGPVGSANSNGFVSVVNVAGANITCSICPVTGNGTGLIFNRKWQFANQFNGAPGTSAYANTKSSSNDQLHIIVIDSNGSFYGSTTSNYILEKYPFVSKASDAKNNNSSPAYYPSNIFSQSKYLLWADHPNNTNWGVPAQGVNFTSENIPLNVQLSGGSDITNPYNYTSNGIGDTNNDTGLETAWSYFQFSDDVTVNLLPLGPASITIQQYVIDNILNSRLDCVGFVSPRYNDVVNQRGSEASNIVNNYLPSLGRSTTYAVCDSGWKYQYDKYNQVYTYIPLNADIAGLCVYTDTVRAPWFSPAGYNRGFIKNVTKLAWSPSNNSNAATGGNGYRDLLYQNAVNPVVTFKNVGTILYGDKTLTVQPSAFDRINVRRLFITLEQAISLAAKYSLFELNDNYTRTAFVNMVNPYLAQVQGQRGIIAYYTQCDTNNNPPQVIQSNQFVGSIFIQPNYSINFITLQFTAVGQGVNFQTLIGTSPPATS
jgi:Phage tail sheath protein subtilisin-like domain/Phage tail sheath C-terminal domain